MNKPKQGADGYFAPLKPSKNAPPNIKLGMKVSLHSVQPNNRNSALQQVYLAIQEFKLEALHYKPAQAYIVRAFQIRFNAETSSFSLLMEAATGDVSAYMETDFHKNNRERSAWWVMRDAFRGLQELWRLNFAHRDIKTGNILWFERRGGPAFKLGDLGNAGPFETNYKNATHLLGTFPPPAHFYWIASDNDKNHNLRKLRDNELGKEDIDVYAMCVVFMYLMVDKFEWGPYYHNSVYQTMEAGIYTFDLPDKMERVMITEQTLEAQHLMYLKDYLVATAKLFCVEEKWENSLTFSHMIFPVLDKFISDTDQKREAEILGDKVYLYDDSAVNDICELIART